MQLWPLSGLQGCTFREMRHNGTTVPCVSALGQAPMWGAYWPAGTLADILVQPKVSLSPGWLLLKLGGITWAGYPYGRLATQPRWPNIGCLFCVGSDHSVHILCKCTCHNFHDGLTLCLCSWLLSALCKWPYSVFMQLAAQHSVFALPYSVFMQLACVSP